MTPPSVSRTCASLRMKIPDLLSPIVGYRAWHWDDSGLRSFMGQPWLPMQPLEAQCRATGGREQVRLKSAHKVQGIPLLKCSCGIYATKSLNHLRQTPYYCSRSTIYGEVCLWGSVVEHELGWRAQFAYPLALHVRLENFPFTISSTQSRVRSLIRYGCNLFIVHDSEPIPLWRKTSPQLEQSGLALLMNRSMQWYQRRKVEKLLKVWDRVAVLGRGIALVRQTFDQCVLVELGRRTAEIPRQDIVWNEQNQRWETAFTTA
jgi:hypothetical protein